jgi:hypothetical protein
MKLSSPATRRRALVLAASFCLLSRLGAEPDITRSRIALFEPAGPKEDTTLAAVLSTVANSVELSLDVLQRYDVTRLPPADPATDLDKVRAYCQKNRMDQAVLGSGSARESGGYSFRLVVYDRKTNTITTDKQGSSNGVLDMFDVTDGLVAALLDGLSGTHLLFGSLAVESAPPGATISVNGRDVGPAPLSLRGLPVGTVELSARLDGYEGAKATVAIADGETTSSSLTLSRSMGVLSVSMPKDAVAAVSGAGIEKKNIQGPGIAMLPAGSYDVEANCPGLPTVKGQVAITGGASTPWVPWTKGYLDVQSDPAGATIVIDGQERGMAPLVVEVEPETLHRVELRKQNYETYRSDVKEDAGSKSLVSGSLTLQSISTPPVEPAAETPPAILLGQPLPRASIKIDGNFDDWKNIPPVAVGSQDAKDNRTISRVTMAADAKSLFIRLDIADKTPGTFSHPHNFREGPDKESYGITIDNGESPKNASVRLYHNTGNFPGGWMVQIEVRENDTFAAPYGRAYITGSQGDFVMKESSVEIAVPLDKIIKLLPLAGPTKRYRVVGWTSSVPAGPNSPPGFKNLKETEQGFFQFGS